jgi:DNA polymerase III sliding clamp (beta) subunit (PCNA family)
MRRTMMKKFKVVVDNVSRVFEEHTYIVEADDEDEALNKAMESNYVAFNYQAVDSDNYETFWDEAEITEHKEDKDD